MALWRQSRVCGDGARRVEFSKLGHLGQQTRRSLMADAGDRIKQLSLSLESRVYVTFLRQCGVERLKPIKRDLNPFNKDCYAKT